MKWLMCLPAAAAIVLAGEAQPIREVKLLGAPQSFPLETKTGEPLDEAKVERDVKALWEARRPADVRVEESTDDGAPVVVFRVEGRHTVMLNKIQVDPPTPGIQPGVAPGQEIDPEVPQRIAIQLHKDLERSGFRKATVDAWLAPAGPRKADLRIHIDKGQAVDVGVVTFTGDLGMRERELRSALRSTRPRTVVPRIPGVWSGLHLLPGYNDDTVPADIANLQSFYYKRGYLAASITAEPVDLSGTKAHVTFDVAAGPRYAIHEMTLVSAGGEQQIRVGRDDTPEAACRELFAERRKAEHTGILDFTAGMEIHDVPEPDNDARRWANLRITMERGRPYETGRITFHGNHRFSESALRASLLVDEGDPLDEMRLRKSMARLNATGFFEPLTEHDVVVNTPPGSSYADVTIWLKEKKAHNWAFSGPVGPMSVAGPLEFSLGSRLPAWGQGLLDLSTYTVSARLLFFAKPIGSLIPFLPNKRFVPLLTISRPLLPGQRFLSGGDVCSAAWLARNADKLWRLASSGSDPGCISERSGADAITRGHDGEWGASGDDVVRSGQNEGGLAATGEWHVIQCGVVVSAVLGPTDWSSNFGREADGPVTFSIQFEVSGLHQNGRVIWLGTLGRARSVCGLAWSVVHAQFLHLI